MTPKTYRNPIQPPLTERAKISDRYRGSARDRGYDGWWRRQAKNFLKAHIMCAACELQGFSSMATVVDHIIPHRGDRTLFRDKSNWQACCAWHHNVVKQRLERLWDDGRIFDADLSLVGRVALDLSERMRI